MVWYPKLKAYPIKVLVICNFTLFLILCFPFLTNENQHLISTQSQAKYKVENNTDIPLAVTSDADHMADYNGANLEQMLGFTNVRKRYHWQDEHIRFLFK